jgi:hypothetical protein
VCVRVPRMQVSLPGHICAVVVTTLVLEGWSNKLDPDHSVLTQVRVGVFSCPEGPGRMHVFLRRGAVAAETRRGSAVLDVAAWFRLSWTAGAVDVRARERALAHPPAAAGEQEATV